MAREKKNKTKQQKNNTYKLLQAELRERDTDLKE